MRSRFFAKNVRRGKRKSPKNLRIRAEKSKMVQDWLFMHKDEQYAARERLFFRGESAGWNAFSGASDGS